MINFVDRFITKNQAYRNNANKADSRYTDFQKRGPLGAVLHSIGTPQPSGAPIVAYFDNPNVEASVHMVLQADGLCYRLAPDNYRMWHVGGSANNTHMGIEMTEPKEISYDPSRGYTLTIHNREKALDHVRKTYTHAVELFADLCKKYGWDPLRDGVILSHSECYKRGIGSNHGDPEHLWKALNTGYTMDGFRRDVKAAMGGKTPAPESVIYRVQCSACREKKNAEAVAEKLKKAGFDTYMVTADGWYKVQTGAYTVKANAEAQLAKLKKAGFDAFITTEKGHAVTTKKSIDEIAREVIKGLWGNGSERTRRLISAGYDPKVVQARVNELMS